MPVLVSGGLDTAERRSPRVRAHGRAPRCWSPVGRWAIRGCLRSCSAGGRGRRRDAEVLERARLGDRARPEHMGSERATRYLRKFYPWYIERLSAGYVVSLGGGARVRAAVQTAPSTEAVRELLRGGVAVAV